MSSEQQSAVLDKEQQKRKARDAAFVTQAGTNWCRVILAQLLERHGAHMHEATREYIRDAEEKLRLSSDFTMNLIDTE